MANTPKAHSRDDKFEKAKPMPNHVAPTPKPKNIQRMVSGGRSPYAGGKAPKGDPFVNEIKSRGGGSPGGPPPP